jgi:agmatinase
MPTFLDLPAAENVSGLDVAVVGVPMDLGVSNRPGARFGPRAVRGIERIGPYHPTFKAVPRAAARAADVGDVPFRSRYSLEQSLEDIESYYTALCAQGVRPLSVGGDHSITYPILKAIGRDAPVGLIHIDAHCDTMGAFDGSKFHHGGPFRLAVLDGVLDPERTIQIGIRGSSNMFWEFSHVSGMTVVYMDEFTQAGVGAIAERARAVVGAGPVYVSVDVDGFDPAFAPGTGTPEVGGLTPREGLSLLRALGGLDIVGADVVEVAPQYDPTTNTVQLAAQLLFEEFSLMTVGRVA